MEEMRRRNGFVYTVFAIFVLGLTFMIVSAQWENTGVQNIGEKFRIDEVFYFLQSTTDDLDRASGIIGRRAMTSLTNHIVTTGAYLDDGPVSFKEAFQNGTVNGTTAPLMNRSTVKSWTAAMQREAKRSGYDLNLSLVSMKTAVENGLKLQLETTYDLNLSDPITRSRFNKNYSVNTTFSYEGVEDPLILIESVGRYTNLFNACPRNTPVIHQSTGTDRFYADTSKNWTSGTAVVRPADGPVSSVSNKGNKVAVVHDLCSYSTTAIENEFTQFKGVVSEQPAIDATHPGSVDVCGDTGVNMNAVIDDAANATNITDTAMTVMTNKQVWQNDIQNWTEQGCYFPDPWGPTVWGRMEGRKSLNQTYDQGIAFFLRVPDLHPALQKTNASAVTYVYFNETGDFGDTRKVKGVTNEQFSWYRLDQNHVDYWGMNPLTYN